ncbi:hypothetical protein GCM10011297_33230 [Bacterioplanes sanyensis]|uniref:CBS domain-containing protein n=1 Tax=Bacterioplanes sanyensis TaxID=1249553 RepID=UPI001674FE51|nr:CBS domain-containing protein [Bacterioplanes sanyensis]GGY57775.1 hypothetical protein GCM10011297_33230 [Bacterioplanes sanyensis]
MSKLTLYPVLNVDELIRPDEAEMLTFNSPAMSFFTDFMRTEPLVIEADLPAAAARQGMLTTHVRLQLVVDKHGAFIGVISAQDLSEQAIVRHIGERRVAREDIRVADLMTRKQDLLALHIGEVEHASIGDVVAFLKDNHQQHCLVVDEPRHQVRGIFSASDISRRLHLPIDIQEQSSFYKVFSQVEQDRPVMRA